MRKTITSSIAFVGASVYLWISPYKHISQLIGLLAGAIILCITLPIVLNAVGRVFFFQGEDCFTKKDIGNMVGGVIAIYVVTIAIYVVFLHTPW